MNERYVKPQHGKFAVYDDATNTYITEFENESHAREFAAAPEMYETLRELLEWERKLGGWDAKVWRKVERIVWGWTS